MKLKTKHIKAACRKSNDHHQEKGKLFGKRTRSLLASLIILAGVLGFVQIYFSGRVAVTGDRISVLEEEKKELSLESSRLQDRLNEISSLSYIEKRARDDLKMVSGIDLVWYVPTSDTLASR